MFRFLRGLFEKEEKPFSLTVDEADGWLDERAGEAEEELRRKTGESRTAIAGSLEGLEEVLRDLEGAEGREDIHPKLRSVTERSLPVFIPAMRQQTGRALPDDPDAFYAAAADLLSSLLKIQKGQGRYLSGVFPDEMKETKRLTAGIGRTLNDLTASVKEAHAGLDRIGEARAALDELKTAQEKERTARAAIPDLDRRIAEAREAIAEKEARARTLRDDPEYRRCLELRDRAEALSGEYERAVQDLRNLAGQAARVLRKAETVAGRTGEKVETKTLAACLDLLKDPAAAGSDAVLAALPGAAGVARAQIARGDLVLKGKDDLALFGEEEKIGQAFLDAFGRCALQMEHLDAARKEMGACTLPKEIEAIEGEIETLISGIEADTANMHAGEEEIKLLEESIPERARRLRQALEGVAGRPLTLEGEGFVIAAET